jgi:hypothetical protein
MLAGRARAQMPRIFFASPSIFTESSCLPALCAASPSRAQLLDLGGVGVAELGMGGELGVDLLHVHRAVVGERGGGAEGEREAARASFMGTPLAAGWGRGRNLAT